MCKNYLQREKRRPHLSVLGSGFAAVVAVVVLASTAGAGSDPDRTPARASSNPWQHWKSIRLKVKAMPLLSGRVWMHLTEGPEHLTFKTESTAKFFGAKVSTSHTRSVIDRSTGLPVSYLSYNSKRARRYAFNETGYVVEKLTPAGKAKRPLSEWTVRKRERFPYPVDEGGSRLPVYDYYSMLLQLRRMPLARVGDEVVLHVATSAGALPYIVRVAELRAREIVYRKIGDKKKVSRVVREMRLQILPADPERGGEGFLKMKGETELWVEAGSKTVLRIGGKVPKIPGRIALVLAEMG